MLVLTREVGTEIIIDDGKISIIVLGISGKQVRLGVQADKEISIDRKEIFERKRGEILA